MRGKKIEFYILIQIIFMILNFKKEFPNISPLKKSTLEFSFQSVLNYKSSFSIKVICVISTIRIQQNRQ